GALTVQIGSIFIPVIDAAKAQLQAILGWFRGLTTEQKANILQWAKIGLAIAGVLSLIPVIIIGIQAVGATLAIFGAELGFATGGITVLLGLLALLPLALGAVGLAADSSGTLWGGLTDAFAAVGNALSDLWTAATPSF